MGSCTQGKERATRGKRKCLEAALKEKKKQLNEKKKQWEAAIKEKKEQVKEKTNIGKLHSRRRKNDMKGKKEVSTGLVDWTCGLAQTAIKMPLSLYGRSLFSLSYHFAKVALFAPVQASLSGQ